MSTPSWFEHEARRRHMEYTAAVERACEEALQSGDAGVLITKFMDGGWQVEVSINVPYGQIHEIIDVPRG